ncbi:MAG: hypothetical protein WB505_05875, partial [Pseudolabrys sp.]
KLTIFLFIANDTGPHLAFLKLQPSQISKVAQPIKLSKQLLPNQTVSLSSAILMLDGDNLRRCPLVEYKTALRFGAGLARRNCTLRTSWKNAPPPYGALR